jgi:acetoin utilization protein AcuB
MLAKDLISDGIMPIRTSTMGEDALQYMRDAVVRHMPIVNNTQFLGLISEDDLFAGDLEAPLGSFELSAHKPYVNEHDHIVEVLRVMGQGRLTLIPVLNDKGDYLGVITQEDLLAYLARATSLAENGSILILEVNRRDYTPGEIGRIIEGEDGIILLMYLSSEPQAEVLEVTIKLHAPSISRIVASLERFKYLVKASYQESDLNENLRENYEALLHYLNV